METFVLSDVCHAIFAPCAVSFCVLEECSKTIVKKFKRLDFVLFWILMSRIFLQRNDNEESSWNTCRPVRPAINNTNRNLRSC